MPSLTSFSLVQFKSDTLDSIDSVIDRSADLSPSEKYDVKDKAFSSFIKAGGYVLFRDKQAYEASKGGNGSNISLSPEQAKRKQQKFERQQDTLKRQLAIVSKTHPNSQRELILKSMVEMMDEAVDFYDDVESTPEVQKNRASVSRQVKGYLGQKISDKLADLNESYNPFRKMQEFAKSDSLGGVATRAVLSKMSGKNVASRTVMRMFGVTPQGTGTSFKSTGGGFSSSKSKSKRKMSGSSPTSAGSFPGMNDPNYMRYYEAMMGGQNFARDKSQAGQRAVGTLLSQGLSNDGIGGGGGTSSADEARRNMMMERVTGEFQSFFQEGDKAVMEKLDTIIDLLKGGTVGGASGGSSLLDDALNLGGKGKGKGRGPKKGGRLGRVLNRIPGAKTAGNLARRAGGALGRGGAKAAAALGIRGGLNAAKAIPVAGQILAAGMAIYDGVSGWNDTEMHKKAFGLGEGEEATTGQKASSSLANILDMGGLFTGAAGLLGFDVDTADIAKKIYDMGSKIGNAFEEGAEDIADSPSLLGRVFRATPLGALGGLFGASNTTTPAPKSQATSANMARARAIESGELGAISAWYESGNKGSDAIGYDTTGGTSYGKYQISSKTMPEFLKWAEENGGAEGAEVARRMREAGAFNTGSRSGQAVDAWRSLVSEGTMGSLEHDFIKATHFDKAFANIQSEELRGKIENSKALQDVLWSTAVQHGAAGKGRGAADIFNKVYKEGMSEEDLINAVYGDRVNRFGSSTAQVQQAQVNRFRDEAQMALAMLNDEREKAAAQVGEPQPTQVAEVGTVQEEPQAAPKEETGRRRRVIRGLDLDFYDDDEDETPARGNTGAGGSGGRNTPVVIQAPVSSDPPLEVGDAFLQVQRLDLSGSSLG